jgi:hypothetical protein
MRSTPVIPSARQASASSTGAHDPLPTTGTASVTDSASTDAEQRCSQPGPAAIDRRPNGEDREQLIEEGWKQRVEDRLEREAEAAERRIDELGLERRRRDEADVEQRDHPRAAVVRALKQEQDDEREEADRDRDAAVLR